VGADTVFISYSHDSPEHSARVLELSNKLRELGVDAEIDQYHTRPAQNWPLWCEERLRPENSKYVLTICTPTYRSRIENKSPVDEGRGVYWEGKIVNQYIYEDKANSRFIPVLLGKPSNAAEWIPVSLRGYTTYTLGLFDLSDNDFERLYRELTNQPAIVKRDLGDRVGLAPKRSAPAISAPLPGRPVLTPFGSDQAEAKNELCGLSRFTKIHFEANYRDVILKASFSLA
jgi:hypothetical protein